MSTRSWRPDRAVVAALALGFFFVPAVAGMLGVRARPIENRPLAPRPSVADGWAVFPKSAVYATDHLPFRDRAVASHARLAEEVFGEPPASAMGTNMPATAALAAGSGPATPTDPGVEGVHALDPFAPTVIVGRDGFQFFAVDLVKACHPEMPSDEVWRNTARLARLVAHAGARLILVVPPDKTSIDTDKLPDRYYAQRCGTAAKARFWQRVRYDPPAGYVDLHGPLQRLRADGPVYRPLDTHWAPRAAAEYARVLADSLDPRLWSTSRVEPVGERTAVGDLTKMLGLPRENRFPAVQVVRPGVTATAWGGTVGGMGTYEVRARTTGAPVYLPPIAIIGDSFTGNAMSQLTPFFASMTSVSMGAASRDPASVAELLTRSRVVVLEAVERGYATGRTGLLHDAYLDALEREIARRRAR